MCCRCRKEARRPDSYLLAPSPRDNQELIRETSTQHDMGQCPEVEKITSHLAPRQISICQRADDHLIILYVSRNFALSRHFTHRSPDSEGNEDILRFYEGLIKV